MDGLDNPNAVDLAFGELEPFAGAGSAVLLTFDFTAVAGQITVVAKISKESGVVILQGTGDAQHDSAGLTGGAAAVDIDEDIKGVHCLDGLQGRIDGILIFNQFEVLFGVLLIDFDITFAGTDAHAGNAAFTASYAPPETALRGAGSLCCGAGDFAGKDIRVYQRIEVLVFGHIVYLSLYLIYSCIFLGC